MSESEVATEYITKINLALGNLTKLVLNFFIIDEKNEDKAL